MSTKVNICIYTQIYKHIYIGCIIFHHIMLSYVILYYITLYWVIYMGFQMHCTIPKRRKNTIELEG